MDRRTEELLAYGQMVLAALFWAGVFPLGKVVLEALDVWSLAALRFAISGLALGTGLVAIRQLNLNYSGRTWLKLAGMSVFGVAGFALFFFGGLSLTTGVEAALIVGTGPAVMALFGYLFVDERLNPRELIAVGASIVGVVLLSVPDIMNKGIFSESLLGKLLMIGAVVGFSTYATLSRNLREDVSAMNLTAVSHIAGGTLLLAWAVYYGDFSATLALDGPQWAAVLAIALLSTAAAYWLQNRSMKTIGPGRAGIVANLVPPLGALLSWAFLQEQVGPWTLAGGAVVVGAVLFTSLYGRTQTPEPEVVEGTD